MTDSNIELEKSNIDIDSSVNTRIEKTITKKIFFNSTFWAAVGSISAIIGTVVGIYIAIRSGIKEEVGSAESKLSERISTFDNQHNQKLSHINELLLQKFEAFSGRMDEIKTQNKDGLSKIEDKISLNFSSFEKMSTQYTDIIRLQADLKAKVDILLKNAKMASLEFDDTFYNFRAENWLKKTQLNADAPKLDIRDILGKSFTPKYSLPTDRYIWTSNSKLTIDKLRELSNSLAAAEGDQDKASRDLSRYSYEVFFKPQMSNELIEMALKSSLYLRRM